MIKGGIEVEIIMHISPQLSNFTAAPTNISSQFTFWVDDAQCLLLFINHVKILLESTCWVANFRQHRNSLLDSLLDIWSWLIRFLRRGWLLFLIAQWSICWRLALSLFPFGRCGYKESISSLWLQLDLLQCLDGVTEVFLEHFRFHSFSKISPSSWLVSAGGVKRVGLR